MPEDQDLTPLRKQYLDIKRQYPHAILFFRLGDFYETFDADAELVARELDLTLTSRPMHKGGARVPLAGVPHHAIENYVAKLIQKGYHVAICEQTSTEAAGRGLFKREVTRVVTPGTVVEDNLLPAGRNNYLAALVAEGDHVGLAYVDISTGEFAATSTHGPQALALARYELQRLRPAEILLPEAAPAEGLTAPLTRRPARLFQLEAGQARLRQHFQVQALAAFGLENQPQAIAACAAVLAYLHETRPAALPLLTSLTTYSLDGFMMLDAATRRSLELTETLRTGAVKGSLLGVLDLSVTPMGARLLRHWVTQPLLDLSQLHQRLDRVAEFHAEGVRRAEVRAALKPLADVERITNRILSHHANPRDLVALRDTLAALPRLGPLLPGQRLDLCADVLAQLQTALADEPPAVTGKPGIIRAGYSAELDGIHAASRHAREWIDTLEPRERERTGLKYLKVGYNKVFGYYIELSRGETNRAPADYIRKQTLVNAERYITPDLKEYETLVLNADERVLDIETRLFRDVCAHIGGQAARLLALARALAQADVLAALAEVAARNQWVRPDLVAEPVLNIRAGRHPVVEALLERETRFVPNDVVFEPGEVVRIITGPNMSGKSTFLRQAALIVLMAQIGSFVPAERARLGLVDRIFTRIGAQDEIHAGQSTFMVEMVETASILHHATARSLLILDEIGRGTSTYDGLSLAWAIVEYIHNHPKLRAKTLFATHYHELTDLAAMLPGVRNYNVAVSEAGEQVVFLHRIVPGGADRSYGIHVAQLAGLPRPVINRAQSILQQLEAVGGRAVRLSELSAQQVALFPETNPLVDELRTLDVSNLTPLEALSKLYEWRARFVEKQS